MFLIAAHLGVSLQSIKLRLKCCNIEHIQSGSGAAQEMACSQFGSTSGQRVIMLRADLGPGLQSTNTHR